MDAIDRKILEYVQEKGRDTYAEIGAAVGLSVSAINERLKKLERAGIMAAVRGGRLRTSWHLYNGDDDVDAALAALRA